MTKPIRPAYVIYFVDTQNEVVLGRIATAYADNVTIATIIVDCLNEADDNNWYFSCKWDDFNPTKPKPLPDPRFDELWDIWTKKGNKVLSQERFPKVLKLVTWEALKQAAVNYMKSKEKMERQFIMNLEGWLNIKYRRWENVVVVVEKKVIYKG